jgi:hypothetical protein
MLGKYQEHLTMLNARNGMFVTVVRRIGESISFDGPPRLLLQITCDHVQADFLLHFSCSSLTSIFQHWAVGRWAVGNFTITCRPQPDGMVRSVPQIVLRTFDQIGYCPVFCSNAVPDPNHCS